MEVWLGTPFLHSIFKIYSICLLECMGFYPVLIGGRLIHGGRRETGGGFMHRIRCSFEMPLVAIQRKLQAVPVEGILARGGLPMTLLQADV